MLRQQTRGPVLLDNVVRLALRLADAIGLGQQIDAGIAASRPRAPIRGQFFAHTAEQFGVFPGTAQVILHIAIRQRPPPSRLPGSF